MAYDINCILELGKDVGHDYGEAALRPRRIYVQRGVRRKEKRTADNCGGEAEDGQSSRCAAGRVKLQLGGSALSFLTCVHLFYPPLLLPLVMQPLFNS